MKIHILVRKDRLRDDYEVSDGESMRAEFDVQSIDISLLSKIPRKEVIIELIDEKDKNLISIVVTLEDLKNLISRIIDEFGDGDESGCNYIL